MTNTLKALELFVRDIRKAPEDFVSTDWVKDRDENP